MPGGVSLVHEHQAGRIKAGAGQRGRVQVAVGRDPRHRAGAAGQHGSGEQRRGGAVLDRGAAGEQLVHRAEGEAAAGQALVQRRQAERQARGRQAGARSALKRRDLRAQGRDGVQLHRPGFPPAVQARSLERIMNKKAVGRGF